MKRVAFRSPSAYATDLAYHPIFDVDRDGRLEMAYQAGNIESMPTNPWRWEVGRFLAFNRWALVYVDTAVWPPPQGLCSGFFQPGDFGDFDGDGLMELVGYNWIWQGSTCRSILCALEQPTPATMPTELAWTYEISPEGATMMAVQLPGDLDGDRLSDLLTAQDDTPMNLVLECAGNNAVRVAWRPPQSCACPRTTYGDFDSDGKREFIGGMIYSSGPVGVWESQGNDQYERVWYEETGLPSGGVDVFAGNDVDQDGRPEFFMAFATYLGGTWLNRLFCWQATGDNQYERVPVEEVWVSSVRMNSLGRSMCADLDGDSVQEIVWSIVRALGVIKSTGVNQFRREWTWINSHHPTPVALNVNIADVNYDGYQDIVAMGDGKISVFEVEAVKVLRPVGGEVFQAGETCKVSWQTFSPPRCDSVSLFLRLDSTYRLDTIAHGLAPADTPYAWVIPDIRADSCWLMAIAYGPGWQYDECDRPFTIRPSGVEETGLGPVRDWALSVSPNPARGRAVVRYDVPVASEVSLSLFDAAGRAVSELATGPHAPGSYSVPLRSPVVSPRSSILSSGVYFLKFRAGPPAGARAGDYRQTEKLVLQR
jgi:hypothetical protein